MKHFFTIVVCLLFITNITAQNGTYFEYKMSSTKGMNGSMKTYCTATGFRSEMQMNMPQLPSGGTPPPMKIVTIIKNDQPNMVIMLDEKTKSYSETPTKESAGNKDNASSNCVVTVIGKEKVGSYNCTHATVTENNKTTEFWLTTEIPDYSKYGAFRKGNRYMGNENVYEALSGKGVTGFPAKILTKDERGNTLTMELTKLEKQTVDAAMFTVPSGYTKRVGPMTPGIPGASPVDMEKLKSMTPEERQKYLEDLKKQYGK